MNEAKDFIHVHYLECLPAGVPLPFKIMTARFEDKKKSKAIATVELFTGDIATLSIGNRPIIHVRWLDLDFNFFWHHGNQQWEVDTAAPLEFYGGEEKPYPASTILPEGHSKTYRVARLRMKEVSLFG